MEITTSEGRLRVLPRTGAVAGELNGGQVRIGRVCSTFSFDGERTCELELELHGDRGAVHAQISAEDARAVLLVRVRELDGERRAAAARALAALDETSPGLLSVTLEERALDRLAAAALDAEDPLQEVERLHRELQSRVIRGALEAEHWGLNAAARRLRRTTSTLQYLLERRLPGLNRERLEHRPRPVLRPPAAPQRDARGGVR